MPWRSVFCEDRDCEDWDCEDCEGMRAAKPRGGRAAFVHAADLIVS